MRLIVQSIGSFRGMVRRTLGVTLILALALVVGILSSSALKPTPALAVLPDGMYAGPPNYNFEVGPKWIVGSATPSNYHFVGGSGSGWSKTGTGTANYSDGNTVVLNGSVQITMSTTYTLASTVDAILIRYKAGGTATVTVRDGSNILGGDDLSCVGCTSGAWVEKYLKVEDAARGVAVKIRIAQSSGTTEVDQVGVQYVAFPSWRGPDSGSGPGAQPRNEATNFMELDGIMNSSPFVIADSALEFDYAFPLSPGAVSLYLIRESDGASVASHSVTTGSTTWAHYRWSWLTNLVGTEVHLKMTTGAGNPVWVDNFETDSQQRADLEHHASIWAGDPVNTITGQFVHSHADVSIPGKGVQLEFSRSYHSMSATATDLGYGWRHSYSARLRIDSDSSVRVFYPSGGAAYFKYNSGTFTAPAYIHDTLVLNGNGTYTLTTASDLEVNFSSTGKLTSFVDRNGNATTISYDGSGHIDEVEDEGGRILDFTVDGSGRITEVADPLARTVEFEYDASGDLIEVTDVKGGITTYTYSNHRMTSLTDSNNHLQNESIYDDANRVVEQTDGNGNASCFYYGTPPTYSSAECTGVSPAPDPGQTIFVNGRGYETTYDFDTTFRTVSVTGHNGGVTSFEYDSEDNRTCVTDPNGNKTGFTYDGTGNLTGLIDAENTDAGCDLDTGADQWTFSYTGRNDPDLATDPLGRERDFIYDSNGNLTRVVREDDSDNIMMLTCFEYGNSDGQVTAVVESTNLTLPGSATDPCTGNKTTYEYDATGNLEAVTDPRFSGQMTPPQTVLDPDDGGRVLSVTDELSHVSSATYDDFNMPLAVSDDLGNTSSWTYDAKGNVETITDANREAVSTAESGADCGAAGTGDGSDDDSDTVVDDGCPNYIYTYENLDRLSEVVDALGNSTTYTYDENGNLKTVTSAIRQPVSAPETGANCANSTGDGDDDDSDTVVDDGCPSTIYSYDELDRFTSVFDALGRETTYDYDAASNLTERVDARGLITEYTPDALNRLEAIDYWNAAHTTNMGSVDYDYDEAGNRIEMIDTTGTTTYVPDPLNRLESVTFPGSVTVEYEYDEVGNRTKIVYPSTDEVDYTFDEGHRMETVTDWLSEQTVYTYDNAGRLDLAELANGVDTDYVYDDANRLTDLTNTAPGPTTVSDYTYTLDAMGNRTQMVDGAGTHAYEYDPLYRLTEVTYPGPTVDAYTYDDNGNRLTKDADDYTYDAADQLTLLEGVSYDYDDNGNQTDRGSDTFAYDHENRLVEAVTGAVTSTSEYNGDGLRMSLEADDGSPVMTDYIWDINQSLPVVLDDGANQYVYGFDLISATDALDDQVYYVHDGLGSVTALTDDTGAVTDTYSYDVFGALRSSTGSTANNWSFTGELSDQESGLYYLRARHYDPATGRFLGKDPLPIGNRYSYVGNNPATFIDPAGLHRWPCPWCPKPKDLVDTFNEAIEAGKSTLDAAADYFSDKGQDAFAVGVHCVEGPMSCGTDVAALALSLGCTGDRKTGDDGWIYYENSEGICNFMFWISDAACYTPGAISFCEIDDPEEDLVCHEFRHFQQSRERPVLDYWIYALGPGEEEAERLETSCDDDAKE